MSDFPSPGMQLCELEPEVKRMLSDEVATGEAESFECLELTAKLLAVADNARRQYDDVLVSMIHERIGKLQRRFGWQ